MKKYRISEFSRRSGVSADTLRFYEKMNLLSPFHQPGNSYRLYSDHDLLQLMQIRLMRSMDMPISTLQKQEGHSLENLYAGVSHQVEALESEIAALTHKLNRFKRIQRELEECRTHIGGCCRVTVPPLHCLYYDESTKDPRFAEQIAQWCAHISYVHLTFRLPAIELSHHDGQPMQAIMGIGLLADYAQSCGIVPVPPVVSTASANGVRILLCIRDPFHPTQEELEPAFAHLKANKLRSVGDWFYRLRFMEHAPDGDMRCYIALRFCVEAE